MLVLVVINSINRLIGHFGLIRRGSDFIFGVGIGLAIGRIGTFLVTIFQLGEKGIIDFFASLSAKLYETTPNSATRFVDDPAVFFSGIIGEIFQGFIFDFVSVEPFNSRCNGCLQFFRRIFDRHQERE